MKGEKKKKQLDEMFRQAGRKARGVGKIRKDCPYIKGRESYKLWIAGWDEANAEIIRPA